MRIRNFEIKIQVKRLFFLILPHKIFSFFANVISKYFFRDSCDSEKKNKTEINKEFTAFIVETAEGGKYVRAWAFHAKGGMVVTISGRKVIIDKQ